MRGSWVYIMTNRPNGTLYTGVTSNIGQSAPAPAGFAPRPRSSWPGLSRPSTPWRCAGAGGLALNAVEPERYAFSPGGATRPRSSTRNRVDGRDKPGHDSVMLK